LNTKQELYCSECEHYVQFVLDDSLNGNHVIKCPNCEHIHFRVVEDGKITDIRYNPLLSAYSAYYCTYTSNQLYSTTDNFIGNSWANTCYGSGTSTTTLKNLYYTD